MDRRGFLRGILAAGMAPAVVKAGIIMPVKTIEVPELWYPVPGLRRSGVVIKEIDHSSLVMTGEIGTIYGMSIVVDRADVKGFVRNPRRNHSLMRVGKKRVERVMLSHPDTWMDIIGRPA